MNARPDQASEPLAKFLPQVKQRINTALSLGSPAGVLAYTNTDEAIQPSMRFSPEVASLNIGSFNFAMFILTYCKPNSYTAQDRGAPAPGRESGMHPTCASSPLRGARSSYGKSGFPHSIR